MKDKDGLKLGPYREDTEDYRIWKGTVAEFFEKAAENIKGKED